MFILRARDRHAVGVIRFYLGFCLGPHYGAVHDRLRSFRAFASKHPERMKLPDTATSTESHAA